MTPFSKSPPTDTVTDLQPDKPQRPEDQSLYGSGKGEYTKSEQVVMGEGQYGGSIETQGPERVNPEGTIDISNAQTVGDDDRE